MSVLTRDQILGATDLQTETVQVPEWGGAVLVRGMTVADRDAFEASLQKPGGRSRHNGSQPPERQPELDLSNFRAKLVVRCVVDEAGKRLFQDSDAKALGEKSSRAVSRIADVAQRLNGMTNADVEEILEKNSETTPAAASSSGSRSPSAARSQS